LKGARDFYTGLWRINLRKEHQQHPQEVANKVYELSNTGELVNYLQKSMFSPAKSAFLQTVKKGHLITWPGLTEQVINKHLKPTPATAMGHMNQRHQNIRSTSKTPITYDIRCDRHSCRLVHQSPSCLCSTGRPGPTIHGFYPKMSSQIKQRQLVCHGMLCF
jgi:hypothetical protein